MATTVGRAVDWRVWWQAARPKTLLAGVCPVAVGTALAWRDHVAHEPSAVVALVGSMGIQIGTNFCNDYFDFVQGADTVDRLGPRRAVQAGLIAPQRMLQATAIAFGVAAVASTYLIARAGWVLAVIAVASILSGFGYTAGRKSLAYVGLGDLFVLVFFGPVAVGGTYFVQALTLPMSVMMASLAPGALAVGILVVNNLRDIDTDRQAGKRTLAVRFGASFARCEYVSCCLFAAATPWLLWIACGWPATVVVVSLALVPSIMFSRQVCRRNGPSLNPLLGQTAALLLLYSLTFSAYCVFQ